MKKNLRIVSAAAAALLAVAPVAASAVSVNAAANQTITLPGAPASTAGDISLASNLKAVTYPEETITNNNTGVSHDHMWDGKISGSVVATFNGKQYTVNLPASLKGNIGLYEESGNDLKPVNANKEGKYRLIPARTYYVYLQGASINLGTENANLSGKTLGSADGSVYYTPVTASYTTGKKFSESDLQTGNKSVDVNGLKTVAPATQGSNADLKADKKGVTIKATGLAEIIGGDQTAGTVNVRYTGSNGKTKHDAVVSAKDVVKLNNTFATHHSDYITTGGKTLNIGTNVNGGVYVEGANHENLGNTFNMLVKVVPTDVTNAESVTFFETATNREVTTGSLNLTANPTSHELNVNTVLSAAKAKYTARQNGDKVNSGAYITTTEKDLTDQLTKAGIKVDPLGNFEAPASFSFNFAAKSDANKATATLPVTVSVTNGVQTPAAQETTKNVTIMHISTIYDKNGKATHEPALRAYDTYSVVATPVNLKDEKGKDAGMFYKLAGKDQYIKVGNVDGTKRSLKKNSYVYKSTGKAYMKSKKHHRVLKAGSSVTTYGKSFMIAGHQMYRIGRNQYVKKANF